MAVRPANPLQNKKVSGLIDKAKSMVQQRKAAGAVSPVNRSGMRHPTSRGSAKLGNFVTSVMDKIKQKHTAPAFKRGGKVSPRKK